MKRKIVVILICLLFIGICIFQSISGDKKQIMENSQYSSNILGLNANLVGYWSFNDGTAKDDYGNHDGTINGDTTYVSTGGPDLTGCFYFDGSGDYIDFGNLGTSVYSFNIWVKPEVTITTSTLAKGLATFEYHKYLVALGSCTGAAPDEIITIFQVSGGEYRTMATNFNINTNWHMITFNWNISQNRYDIFYDGIIKSVTKGSAPAHTTLCSSPYFLIARTHHGGGSEYFDGYIDEVRIYSNSLTPSEIQNLYNSPGGENNPPSPPTNPSPYPGAIGIDVNAELSWSCSDPDSGDSLTYNVYFGTNPNPPLVSIGQTGNTYKPATMSYSTPYYWKIVAKDNHGAVTNGSIWSFTTTDQPNNPPDTPSRPSGPAAGWTGTIKEFSTSSVDPDNDQIKYGWDWNGNDIVDEWTNYMSSNITCYRTHIWDKAGTYNIKVKVKDSKGAVSDWSDFWKVTIQPRNEDPNPPSNPSPSNHASNVDINYYLSWNCIDPDGDPLTYDVYFGINSNPPKVTPIPQVDSIYDPAQMICNTTYYWKIIAYDDHGKTTSGPIWSFTTTSIKNYPPTVYLFFPEENDNVSGFVNIYGTASDPNGNNTLTMVEVNIDNKSWNFASGTEYWNYSWNTMEETNDIHTIYIRSFDGEFYSNLSIVNVTVFNAMPKINISNINGGFGISTYITNYGLVSAFDLNWSINVEASLGLILSGEYTDGIITELDAGDSVTIQSYNLRGIGLITINIQAADAEKQTTAFLLGPLVFRVNEI